MASRLGPPFALVLQLAGVQQMAVGEADAGLRELAAEEAKQLQAQVRA